MRISDCSSDVCSSDLPSPLSRVTFPTHGRTRAIARLESVACIKLIEDYLIRTPPKGSVGRTETARFESRTAKSGLASEGLRHEIAAEAKSDGIDGMRHAVGAVCRDVDAEPLELALRHVQRRARNHGIACALPQNNGGSEEHRGGKERA